MINFFQFLIFLISSSDRGTPSVRSTSAIDLQAAQRAKARMMYANMSRQKASLREYLSLKSSIILIFLLYVSNEL